MLSAFNDGSGVPYSDVNLGRRTAHGPVWSTHSSVSEITTIQLEFKDLTHETGKQVYWDKVTRVMEHMDSLSKTNGLVPQFIDPHSGQFGGGTITLGARGDSYYEYLLKQYLQTGKTEERYKRMYLESVKGIMSRLVKKSEPNKLTFIAELVGSSQADKMDHLVCFLPGTLALGAHNGLDPSGTHMQLAKDLLATCYEMYRQMPTGLSPEIAYFNTHQGSKEDLNIHDADTHNLLRPETVESLFYLYRFTKNEMYREWGWKIFQAFEKHTRVASGGYSSLNNVKQVPPSYRDKMESFFLGETLKYFFLLFSDNPDLVSLDKYVINTEAHIMPIFTP
eukprot:m.334477 g.334477  ORF g.334477 m.334477 type:complete len:336 (+) comp55667_c0_seq4:198-1205(+)